MSTIVMQRRTLSDQETNRIRKVKEWFHTVLPTWQDVITNPTKYNYKNGQTYFEVELDEENFKLLQEYFPRTGEIRKELKASVGAFGHDARWLHIHVEIFCNIFSEYRKSLPKKRELEDTAVQGSNVKESKVEEVEIVEQAPILQVAERSLHQQVVDVETFQRPTKRVRRGNKPKQLFLSDEMKMVYELFHEKYKGLFSTFSTFNSVEEMKQKEIPTGDSAFFDKQEVNPHPNEAYDDVRAIELSQRETNQQLDLESFLLSNSLFDGDRVSEEPPPDQDKEDTNKYFI